MVGATGGLTVIIIITFVKNVIEINMITSDQTN